MVGGGASSLACPLKGLCVGMRETRPPSRCLGSTWCPLLIPQTMNGQRSEFKLQLWDVSQAALLPVLHLFLIAEGGGRASVGIS